MGQECVKFSLKSQFVLLLRFKSPTPIGVGAVISFRVSLTEDLSKKAVCKFNQTKDKSDYRNNYIRNNVVS